MGKEGEFRVLFRYNDVVPYEVKTSFSVKVFTLIYFFIDTLNFVLSHNTKPYRFM